MIGDPCYASADGNPDHPIHNWGEFCNSLQKVREDREDGMTIMSMPFALGHEGRGVVIESGFGDGTYPVYVTVKDCGDWGRRIVKAEIFFDEDPYDPDAEESAF